MQPESAALLWDARRAAELIGSFITGRTWSDYLDDPMLRAPVRDHRRIAQPPGPRRPRDRSEHRIPRIVAFRNVLIHGYATIDDAIVWEVATERLPGPVNLLSTLLDGE